jgi:hypothetical protein
VGLKVGLEMAKELLTARKVKAITEAGLFIRTEAA